MLKYEWILVGRAVHRRWTVPGRAVRRPPLRAFLRRPRRRWPRRREGLGLSLRAAEISYRPRPKRTLGYSNKSARRRGRTTSETLTRSVGLGKRPGGEPRDRGTGCGTSTGGGNVRMYIRTFPPPVLVPHPVPLSRGSPPGLFPSPTDRVRVSDVVRPRLRALLFEYPRVRFGRGR